MKKQINKKKNTRELILQAAKDIFAEKGFNGATTAEIAKAAGVAEGTIYRYFKTKKDLLLNITTPLVITSLEDILKDLQECSNEELLKAILKNRIKLISENLSLVKIVIIEGQYYPELKTSLFEGLIIKAMGVMENYVVNQIKAGVFRDDINPQIAVRTLVGGVAGLIVWKSFFLEGKDDILTDDEFINQIIKIFLDGMNNR